jgi:hypothetical protein
MDMATTTHKEPAMKTSNPTPLTSFFVWHGEADWAFAMIQHDGHSYTLRRVPEGINVYFDIDGEDCIIAQVDTEDEARTYISHHAYQQISF